MSLIIITIINPIINEQIVHALLDKIVLAAPARHRLDKSTSEAAKHCCWQGLFDCQEPGGGGVHDLRMDGGLPPGFQKGTLF